MSEKETQAGLLGLLESLSKGQAGAQAGYATGMERYNKAQDWRTELAMKHILEESKQKAEREQKIQQETGDMISKILPKSKVIENGVERTPTLTELNLWLPEAMKGGNTLTLAQQTNPNITAINLPDTLDDEANKGMMFVTPIMAEQDKMLVPYVNTWLDKAFYNQQKYSNRPRNTTEKSPVLVLRNLFNSSKDLDKQISAESDNLKLENLQKQKNDLSALIETTISQIAEGQYGEPIKESTPKSKKEATAQRIENLREKLKDNTKKLSGKDQQALDWAKKNPTDKRAILIKQKLGIE